jgi:hypothetical protein
MLSDDGPTVTIEVDLPDFSHANIVILRGQMGTPTMEGMLRLAVRRWADTRAAVAEPGGS